MKKVKSEVSREKLVKLINNHNKELGFELINKFLDGNLKENIAHVKVKVDKLYKRTEKALHASQSLPKQCRIVLESITTSPIDINTWTKTSLSNKLETNQTPERIVMYYRPRLIELGLVEEVK